MGNAPVSSLCSGSLGDKIPSHRLCGRTWRVVARCSFQQVRMLNTVETGEANFRVILEQIDDTVNELEGHVVIEHVVNIPWTHLKPFLVNA